MEPILLQKQIKDNANDLQEFCKDLKAWGEEMQKKDSKQIDKNASTFKIKYIHHKNHKISFQNIPAKPKKKICKDKQIKTNDNSTKGKKVVDYTAWDKYDVEAECARIDENSSEDSDVSDEIDEANMDFAMQEKEKVFNNNTVKLS